MARQSTSTYRRVALAAGLAVLAVLLVWLYVWWTTPPQMGADEEVFTSVDALFTAVRARDEKLLGQCERRLHALKDAGKLPPKASNHLDAIIRQARAGHWQSAAETLYGFMLAQRREGASHKKEKKVRAGK